MEFRDLKKQYQVLKPQMDAAIGKVLQDCNFISGKQVAELEEKLAQYVGVKHCVTCGNGTDALSLVMMAWEIKEGDAVFVPDFTFFASAEVVAFEGATPIFVDVDERSFNIDPDKLEQAICAVEQEGKLRPCAVVAVDLFGQPADYRRIEEICRRHNLLLLEDGAQGFGGMLNQQKWVGFDPEKCAEATVEIVVQLAGKIKARLHLAADSSKEKVLAAAKAEPAVAALIQGKSVVKEIYVPGKLVNLVVK